MAAAEPKSSFLGSISPWAISRSASPQPRETQPDGVKPGDPLMQSAGLDHSIRPFPNSKKYPRDCPSLKVRWFYAVDLPKRKPFSSSQLPEEPPKPAAVPKKLVPFSVTDSQSLESAYNGLVDQDETTEFDSDASKSSRTTKVPVNEDFLFDVDIEKRELEPAYWIGPVYSVCRGSWFYEGSPPRPCDENLANQLEEGYLKIAPWRRSNLAPPRSASQPRSRPTSLILDGIAAAQSSVPGSPKLVSADRRTSKAETSTSNSYRLFGAYMNTTATYQDGTVAWLTSDDFMSRMSNTMYGRFGGLSGTKVIRGFAESEPAAESKILEVPPVKDGKRNSVALDSAPESEKVITAERAEEGAEGAPIQHRRSALERQLSSLAGAPNEGDSEELAEEARQQEEKEMEDYRENDAKEQGREIEHLVLVTHGIGQRLGLRLDSINFIHDVNVLRKTMKAVYSLSPDLQALNSQVEEIPNNCKIQVLPVCWRHLLDFPKQSVRQNRKEFDLGDADGLDENEYPSLADITVDGVPAVRNLITDLAMDVLLYQSGYREHIAGIVRRECNRLFKLFKERNPTFSGRVSLVGHSLGSAILFDILCRQREGHGPRMRMPSRGSKDHADPDRDLQLDFECENFFCLGSPIALFQMLKGRTIVGRKEKDDEFSAKSPFDPDTMRSDPFLQTLSSKTGGAYSSALPITVSSPKCSQLYNIFHPTDPISYRMEPLISPAMTHLKPQPLPYTKKGLFDAPGIANIGARVGQSVGSMWYNFTSGVASSLLNRSLGITGEEQALPPSNSAASKGNSTIKAMRDTASTGLSVNSTGGGSAPTMPIADEKKQQALADKAKLGGSNPNYLPTLIDSEVETLYSEFQKRRQADSNDSGKTEYEEASERARKLKREEAKVRALNSNGRVDYSIQEGVFDISLLASIASHLSYWADEDVNHFMLGQMLSSRGRGRREKEDEK